MDRIKLDEVVEVVKYLLWSFDGECTLEDLRLEMGDMEDLEFYYDNAMDVIARERH